MGNAPPTGLAAALTDPAAIRDPYPVYDDLRARAPVHWAGELGAWVLTRYSDATEVLRDVGAFASDWRRAGEELPPAVRSIQTLDLVEHAVVRRLFADGFRHGDQRGLADRGARRVRGRLAALAGARTFDFITEVAEPVALATVTDFLGVAPPSLDWFIPLSHTIVDGMDAGLWPQTARRVHSLRFRRIRAARGDNCGPVNSPRTPNGRIMPG
jgi:cytochrome P450